MITQLNDGDVRGGRNGDVTAVDGEYREVRRLTSSARVALVLTSVLLFSGLLMGRAEAATLSVTPPPAAPAEDSGFAIAFSGNASDFTGGAYLFAEIAPAGGAPCGPTPSTNEGRDVSGASGASVEGQFAKTGSVALSTAGTYLICAWLTESSIPCCGERIDPPVAATVTVRPPTLTITTSVASHVRAGTPFAVTVNYQAEVPRLLTVLVARASSCSISSEALKGISTRSAAVADQQEVSGVATIRGAVRFDEPGRYLVCGFFEKGGEGEAAQYAFRGQVVTVEPRRSPLRSCGYVGGPQRIRQVTARSVACTSAKSIARSWGRRQRPKRISVFRCTAAAGRARCTASRGRVVSFRYGR